MPSSTLGFSGNEIVEHVKKYIGNQSSTFQTFLENSLALCEQRFCKAHDWSFLKKQNLNLTVVSGTVEYTLETGSIGFYMAASDVYTIFNPANNAVLRKVTLDEIRRMDPDQDDGSTNAQVTHWAPSGDNKIVIYPVTFATTQLKVDGKITPTALLTLTNYPTIPYRYQESFIEYVKAIALDRENDDRAPSQRQFAMGLMRQDIADDLASLGDTELPRVKAYGEQVLDGRQANLDQIYNLFAFYD